MLFFGLFCLGIICMAVMYSAIFERRFEETVGLAVFTDIVILFIAGFLDKLSIGFIAVLVVSALGFLISICIALSRACFKILALNTFTLGFFVFLIALVVIYLACEGMTFPEEANVTIDNIKLIATNESITQVATSYVTQLGHQPGYALFCYMFTSLNGDVIDAHVIRGAAIFVVAMVLPIFSRMQWKSIVVGIFSIVTFFLFPWIFTGNMEIVHTVNVDAAVAVSFAFLLFVYMCHEMCGYTFWALGIGSAALVLMKPGMFLFVLLFMFIVALDVAGCGYRDFAEMLSKPGKWISVVLYPAVMLATVFGWWYFAGTNGILRLDDCLFLTAERSENYAKIFTDIITFFQQDGTTYGINITFYGWLFIFAVLGGAAAALGRDKWDRIRTGVRAFIVIIGFVLYMFVLAFAYTYLFPTDTDISLTLNTYLTIYLVGAMFFFINLLIGKLFDRYYTFGRLVALIFVVMVLILAPITQAYDATIGRAKDAEVEISLLSHNTDTEVTQSETNI